MKNKGMKQQFGFAWAGIVVAWRNERSFRIQTIFAIGLVVVLLLLRPPSLWWALCVISAVLVLAAELFNTALEVLVDHLHPEIHPAIKTAKDCAAGAVLLLSAGALLVGILTVLVALGFLS
ncbi:MAG TPA: diacylglycerol kinase [Polaromonas sp.]|uniref:diacylglycerol kinase n=1 Tax=Polaromonas sp. UBA4122 TaxID=1947074 RepID=UPI000EE4CBAE|nr:diacylglycerol kinase [Polaromonas sp. UBA4122]HAL38385.1 diacylglycerol kinase [Polaromonas sp.]